MPVLVECDECRDLSFPVPIQVGSDRWFQWLENHRTFRFECSNGCFTANKDSSGYWTAIRKVNGRLRRKRLGRSPNLTLQRLVDTAILLALGYDPIAYEQSKNSPEYLKTQISQLQTEVARYKECWYLARQKITALELELLRVSQSAFCDTDEKDMQ